jgi:hypothetical protein
MVLTLSAISQILSRFHLCRLCVLCQIYLITVRYVGKGLYVLCTLSWTYRRHGNKASYILSLGTRWEWVTIFTSGNRGPCTHCGGNWVYMWTILNIVGNERNPSIYARESNSGSQSHRLFTALLWFQHKIVFCIKYINTWSLYWAVYLN